MTPTDLKDMHDAEMRGGDAPELKPCPFCGDDMSSMGEADHEGYFATCEDGLAAQCIECGTIGPFRASREAALAAWNTRADLAPDGAAFEQMREALEWIGTQAATQEQAMSRARATLKAAEWK